MESRVIFFDMAVKYFVALQTEDLRLSYRLTGPGRWRPASDPFGNHVQHDCLADKEDARNQAVAQGAQTGGFDSVQILKSWASSPVTSDSERQRKKEGVFQHHRTLQNMNTGKGQK